MKALKWLTANMAVVALVLALVERDAYGYLDPGTGSYLLQLFIAGALGSLFAIKVYWGRIKAFLLSRFAKGAASPEEGADRVDGDD